MTRHERLAHDRERLDEQIVEIFALFEPAAELTGLGLEGVVGERLHLGFERVDLGHERSQCLERLPSPARRILSRMPIAASMLPAPRPESR